MLGAGGNALQAELGLYKIYAAKNSFTDIGLSLFSDGLAQKH